MTCGTAPQEIGLQGEGTGFDHRLK